MFLIRGKARSKLAASDSELASPFPRILKRTNLQVALAGALHGHGGPVFGPMVGFGYGPEVAYIPYHVASVWFSNQRVDSWERAR